MCTVVGVKDHELSEYSCTVQSAVDNVKHQFESNKNSESLCKLISNNILSKGMADKISNSGLCLSHLKLAFKRSEMEGVNHLLSESISLGKPRKKETKNNRKSI